MESDTKTLNMNEGFFSRHKHTLMMVLGCAIPLLLLDENEKEEPT